MTTETSKWVVGRQVYVQRQDEEWGRIAEHGTITEVKPRYLLVLIGGQIRANVCCLRSECRPVLHLYLRVGEGSNYENYGEDMDALALAAYDQGVRPPYRWFYGSTCGGFDCAGYEGPVSYVSLYWGDEKANFVRCLTREEKRHFARCMRQEAS